MILVIVQSYQIVAFPNFLPSLLAEPDWHLSPGSAGLVGSLVFLGILAGTAAALPSARIIGRRRATLSATLWLTLWSGVSALAASPWQLGLSRLIAGFGMGIAFPLILSFLHDAATRTQQTHAEVTRRARRLLPIVLLGMPIAGVIAQNVAGALPVHHGWRLLTAVGASLGILSLVLSALLLPRGADTFGWESGRAGPRLSHRVVAAAGAGLVVVNVAAWYGLTAAGSADLRFNAVLDAGAIATLFALAGLAIRRGEPRARRWRTIRATLTFLMLNPATAVVAVFMALYFSGAIGTAFIMAVIGVWIADCYCRAVVLSMAPVVLFTPASATATETRTASTPASP